MDLKKELLFKCLILGDFGVGKTSIVRRYAEDAFSNTYKITIGADFALKTIEWDQKTRVNLQLWDIAGHERFGTLTSVYYRYALAAAVVFDLTRPDTLKSTEKWIKDLRKRTKLPNGANLPVILLANKGDVKTDNIPENINDFCMKNQILCWLITSAKENVNIDVAINKLVESTLDSMIEQEQPSENNVLLNKTEKTEEKCNCFF